MRVQHAIPTDIDLRRAGLFSCGKHGPRLAVIVGNDGLAAVDILAVTRYLDRLLVKVNEVHS